VTPPTLTTRGPPSAQPVMTVWELLKDLASDRADE
jgi:hypothetical protein